LSARPTDSYANLIASPASHSWTRLAAEFIHPTRLNCEPSGIALFVVAVDIAAVLVLVWALLL
jgi:hypothetical protein